MIFKGQILHIGGVKEGKTKDGKEWSSIDFVAEETEGQYPQKGVFSLFKSGEYIKNAKEFSKYNKIGDVVVIDFSMKANEYEGRYYGANSVFKINKETGTQSSEVSQEPSTIFFDSSIADSDLLPF